MRTAVSVKFHDLTQQGYGKYRTLAKVFSQALAHGDSMNSSHPRPNPAELWETQDSRMGTARLTKVKAREKRAKNRTGEWQGLQQQTRPLSSSTTGPKPH